MKPRLLLFFLLLIASATAEARLREAASWSYLALSKKLDQKWTLSTQTELRTGENFKSLYLWYLDGTVKYNVNSWLALSAGFDYIKIHSRATAKRPAVWRTDYRPYIAIAPSWSMGKLKCNFNQSWCYNYMPQTHINGIQVNGKAFHLLRHRLHVSYPVQGTRFTPYGRVEVRHTDKMERIRFTLASYIKLTQKTMLDVGYIYQDMHKSMKTHALALGYRIAL